MTLAGNSTPATCEQGNDSLDLYDNAADRLTFRSQSDMREAFVNPKLIFAVLVIAAAPVCARAQKPSAAKVTKADVQKIVQLISGDKAKTEIYCNIGKLNEQIAEADETKDAKKAAELAAQIEALGKKLGPEFTALVDRLQDVDPESEDGKQIGSMLEPLDKLCAR